MISLASLIVKNLMIYSILETAKLSATSFSIFYSSVCYSSESFG